MQGIVITSHGEMAKGILDTSKLFFGDQKQIVATCLKADDNPDSFVEKLKAAIKEVDTGDGVIVFCDMLFGSPCNCMARIIGENLEDDKVQVITGVNLAMILQVLSLRESSKVEANALIEEGHKGIAELRAILKENL